MNMPRKNRARYVSVRPKDRVWGLYLLGAGGYDIPAHTYYTVGKESAYKRRTGRILPEFCLVYLARGRGVFNSRETGRVNLRTGDIFLVFPQVWHDYRPDPTTGWHEYWVLFNGDQPNQLVEQGIITSTNPLFRHVDGAVVEELYCQVLDGICSPTPVSSQIVASITMQLLAVAIAGAGSSAAQERALEPEIQKAKRYIEEHLAEAICIADLAAELGTSYRHFSRLFKASVGVSPQQYHIELRINRAKELLVDRNNRIGEISAQLGFYDPLYFCRLFRKQTNHSPSEWRDLRGQIIL